MARPYRKPAAVVFTDVVGYSALVDANEHFARELLERHRRLLSRHIALRRGRLIDSAGDGTLSIFDGALDASRDITWENLLNSGLVAFGIVVPVRTET